MATLTKNYTIDQKAGTITYWHDTDTDNRETASIAEVLDLLFWLRSRETELRQMVYKHAPIAIRRPMQLVNGYYIGVTDDMQSVKVSLQRFQEVWEQTQLFARRQWLEAQQYKKEMQERTAGVQLIHYRPGDNTGAEVLQTSPLKEDWTEADAPDEVVNEALQKLRTPEFWANRGDNLDSGKFIKLP